MIFIIYDNYTYEVGVKTVLAGILALLLGLIGFVASLFALGVMWFVPAMGMRTPPYRNPNSVHLKKHRGPVLHEVLPLQSTTSLRRAASFPDLHKMPSSQQLSFTNMRHVSFHLDKSECYNTGFTRSVSMSTSPMSLAIQHRWLPRPFSKRRSTCEESIPCARTPSPAASNTVTCNSASPTSKNDLPLGCVDELCESHGCRNSAACDENGIMDRSQVDSLSEDTTSKRSSLTISLRLSSVRKVFGGIPRLVNVSPRTSAVNIDTKESSQKQIPTPESPSKGSDEVYRAERVNPLRTKKSKIKPRLDALKLNHRFSLSPPWSGPKSAGSSPDADSSTSSLVSANSPPAFRRKFTNRFTSSLKSPTVGSLSSSALDFPSPASSSCPQATPQLKGRFTSRSTPRTQPYGPPWNAVMPGYGHGLADGSLDDAIIKKSLRRRSAGHGEFRRPFKGLVNELEDNLSS